MISLQVHLNFLARRQPDHKYHEQNAFFSLEWAQNETKNTSIYNNADELSFMVLYLRGVSNLSQIYFIVTKSASAE